MKTCSPDSASEMFYLAIVAFGKEDYSLALEYAERAATAAPRSLVFRHAVTYLRRILEEGKPGVYVTGEAFSRFIRAGSNLPLYERTSAALRQVYQEYETLDLLDIGVGDGLALLPAVNEHIRTMTLLEPSTVMLNILCRELDARHLSYQAVCSPLQEFVKTPVGQWHVIESTFCLHAIPPLERPDLFVWMREHGDRVVLAEFDVPGCADMYDPQWVHYIMERYEQGLAEYSHDGGIVAQGFLLPVLFGNFDRTTARTTYEQPIQTWKRALEQAGFHSVTIKPLFPYWWATAYVLDAT